MDLELSKRWWAIIAVGGAISLISDLSQGVAYALGSSFASVAILFVASLICMNIFAWAKPDESDKHPLIHQLTGYAVGGLFLLFILSAVLQPITLYDGTDDQNHTVGTETVPETRTGTVRPIDLSQGIDGDPDHSNLNANRTEAEIVDIINNNRREAGNTTLSNTKRLHSPAQYAVKRLSRNGWSSGQDPGYFPTGEELLNERGYECWRRHDEYRYPPHLTVYKADVFRPIVDSNGDTVRLESEGEVANFIVNKALGGETTRSVIMTDWKKEVGTGVYYSNDEVAVVIVTC
jgi:hypothetical protein